MSTARPGIALRSLRKQNQWTLAVASRRTGIPASTLSRIENDQMSPTYDLLVRISTGLSIDLSELLSAAEPGSGARPGQSGRRSINRGEDGEVVQMPGHTLRYLSSDFLNKRITPIVCEYRARSLAEFGAFMQHEGEEFLYVLEGELELHTESYAPLVLKAGESTYYDSAMGHAYIARGKGVCRALSVCTVPRLAEHATDAGASPEPVVPAKAGRRAASRRAAPRTRAGRSRS